MNKEIGDVLRNARESKRLRQEDMALRLGISARQYQKYEEGVFPKYKSEPVSKIDEILGTNIYELIYEQGVMTNPTPPQNLVPLEEDSYKNKYIALLEERSEHYNLILNELKEIKKLLNMK